MHRNVFTHLIIAAVGVITLAACSSGSGQATPGSTTAPTASATTAPPTPSTPMPAYPRDPEVALVRIGRPGEAPHLVIGGDGWVYFANDSTLATAATAATPASTPRGFASAPAAVPPPAAPTALSRRQLTAAGLDEVIALAATQGLFTNTEYDDPGVTDMGTTEVTVTDARGTFVHDADALGYEEEVGARKQLLDFIDSIDDLEHLVGTTNLGPAEPYQPMTFVVSVGGSYDSVRDDHAWPTDVPVTTGCVELPIGAFPAGVAGLYSAVVDGQPARVAVAAHLPGDACA